MRRIVQKYLTRQRPIISENFDEALKKSNVRLFLSGQMMRGKRRGSLDDLLAALI